MVNTSFRLSPELQKEQAFPIEQESSARALWLKKIKKTRDSGTILIRSGEWSPRLTESCETIVIALKVLERGVKFIIICHKQADSLDAARKIFQHTNPEWWKLSKSYPEQIFIYWRPKRPIYHYTIFNDRNVYIEEVHVPDYEKATLFRSDDTFAKELTIRFNKDLEELTTYRL